MSIEGIIIDRATVDDVEGIVQLQNANQVQHGGTLSADFTYEEVAATIGEIPNIVARQEGRVVGFLLTFEKSAPAPAIVKAMLDAYAGREDAYVYGPICVDGSVRGRGVAGGMFDHLLRLVPDREGILFIKGTNTSSLRAHAKMAMRQVAKFIYNESEYLVLAYNSRERIFGMTPVGDTATLKPL